MLLRIPQPWSLPEREAAPESAWINRRQLVRTIAAGLGGTALLAGAPPAAAKRNPEFELKGVTLTPEWAATGYNNYYEFHPTDKQAVKNSVGAFVSSSWSFEVTGLVDKPQKFDLDQLLKSMPLEERVYRFRCVERWAMAVPWTGFRCPLSSKKWIRSRRPGTCALSPSRGPSRCRA